MKYFPHDSNSFQDEKITLLFMGFGFEGLGLFYTVLERLTFHEKPINTKVLKKQLGVGKKLEKCWAYMEEIGLLVSENGETLNVRVMEYCESLDEKREKNAERVSRFREKKVKVPQTFHKVPTKFVESLRNNEENNSKQELQYTEKQGDEKSVTHYDSLRNALNIDIDIDIDKTETKQENTIPEKWIAFEVFWGAYGKKEDRAKSEKKWKSLPLKTQELIMEDIPKYRATLSDPKYQKNPLTYLNGQCWLDERTVTPLQSQIKTTGGPSYKSLNDRFK